VRMIDESKCAGCQTCLSACPFIPHRPIWNPVKGKRRSATFACMRPSGVSRGSKRQAGL
jgi:Fe-S-cluster-containing hydrogenase component 2